MRLFLFIALTAFSVLPAVARADSDADELYYSLSPTLPATSRWEVRTLGGYDFSNSYLNIYSAGIGTYWLWNPAVSFGVEANKFGSSLRNSAEELRNQLGFYGFKVQPIAPSWSSVGLVRITPISGLVNFFSSRVLLASISVVLQGGVLNYQDGLGTGPVLGTALEAQLGIAAGWGVVAGVNWDGDKPPGQAWQSRVGFRLGPTLTF